MKNIMNTLYFLLEGAARIFDFAGALNEEGLHETQDAAAIHKDWVTVGRDYGDSSNYFRFPPMVTASLKRYFQSEKNKNCSELKNRFKKKRNGTNKPR